MTTSINSSLYTRTLHTMSARTDLLSLNATTKNKTDSVKTGVKAGIIAPVVPARSAKISPAISTVGQPTQATTGLRIPMTFTNYIDKEGNIVCGMPSAPTLPPKSAPIPEPDPAAEKRTYLDLPPKSAPISEPEDTRENARVLMDKYGGRAEKKIAEAAVPEPVIDQIELG